MQITRRGVQVSLGVLWIADGALQLQPAMFTGRFARNVIAAAGSGQPKPVHWLVTTAASVIGHAPVLFDSGFAAIQLLLGFALLFRRTTRLGLVLSIPWAFGVWAIGEGFGGIFGAGSTALSGAPGAALLYGALALSAWPASAQRVDDRRPAPWLPLVWATLWAGFALLDVLPGRGSDANIARSLTANLSGLPRGIAATARSLAGFVGHAGITPGVVLAIVLALVGLVALRPGASRIGAGLVGAAFALAIWVLAEGFGGITTGLGTDPNTGPLLVLFAIAMCSAAPGRACPLDDVAGKVSPSLASSIPLAA